MSKYKFTSEQLADRWIDLREIKNLMGKLVMHGILRMDLEIFDASWCGGYLKPTLGVNDGYYTGEAAVRGYYQAITEKTALQSGLLKEKFPDELGGMSDEELFGVGSLAARPVTTPVIELSGDGETAKGLWYVTGEVFELTEAGPLSVRTWGRLAVDFIREDRGWRIWHMLWLEDIHTPCGESWTDAEQLRARLPEFAALGDFTFPAPNVPEKLFERYHKNRPVPAFPPVPEPYGTFGETFSYGL